MKVHFSAIRISAHFVDVHGTLWFRIMTYRDNTGTYNAERVSDGHITFFNADTLVEKA